MVVVAVVGGGVGGVVDVYRGEHAEGSLHRSATLWLVLLLLLVVVLVLLLMFTVVSTLRAVNNRCTLSSAHWQQASKRSSPCGALSRFEKIEIKRAYQYNTIQYVHLCQVLSSVELSCSVVAGL